MVGIAEACPPADTDKEGFDGDKWSKTTQDTLGGSGVSKANGVLRKRYHPPDDTIYKRDRLISHIDL